LHKNSTNSKFLALFLLYDDAYLLHLLTTPHQSFLKHRKRIAYRTVCAATCHQMSLPSFLNRCLVALRIIASEDSEECPAQSDWMTTHCHHCHMPANIKHSLVHILATTGIHCIFRAPVSHIGIA